MFNKIIGEIKKRVSFKQEEFDLFSEKLTVQKLYKDDVWEQKGEIGQLMGFVNYGSLKQYYIKDEVEYIDTFYVENDFAGNYISYISQTPSETYTVAIEPCELLIIPFKELEKLYETLPVVEQFSRIIGEEKLVELNKRKTQLLIKTPEQRYYNLMKQKPELFQRIPQYLIARYLGIRPESLSRIRKRHIS